jgi:hypothetical protein
MNSILDAVCNYVNNYNPLEPPRLTLLPTLNQIYIDEMRDVLRNEPNQTVRLAATRPSYAFYFCKLGDQIYQVIEMRQQYDVSMV